MGIFVGFFVLVFFFNFLYFLLVFLTVIFDASLVILQKEECSTIKLSCDFYLGLLRTVLLLL